MIEVWKIIMIGLYLYNDSNEKHKHDGGLYLYNDRDEEHKYDGDFTYIKIEMMNINMMATLRL